jgi:dTDP-4-amino-4,6-dideoxygalactose transaminase
LYTLISMPTLAISGGQPVRSRPFAAWPVFDDTEKAAVLEVLESGSWGGYNAKVGEFERRFAAEHGCEFGIACANGTVSLEAAMLACGIQPGDEVIVPPITFIATATAVVRMGAVPVFADIDSATYNLRPESVSEAISDRTRAIIPVHFAGQPADMDALGAIAARSNLVIMEDAAHAHGASWRGRKAGSFGLLNSFSFQQSKNMTAGEGGIVITNDEDAAERVRSICNQGRRKGGAWYEHPNLGSNFRLTGWQAAILLAQLSRLPQQMERRARSAAVLTARLNADGIVLAPSVDTRVTGHSWYLYTMRMNPAAFEGISKELLIRALTAEGIPGIATYPYPIYDNHVFEQHRHRRVACPEAERFARECFWVSHEILLAAEADMNDFVRAVNKVATHADELRAFSGYAVAR